MKNCDQYLSASIPKNSALPTSLNGACCPWPWLSPPLIVLQYIMYRLPLFQIPITGSTVHHVFFEWLEDSVIHQHNGSSMTASCLAWYCMAACQSWLYSWARLTGAWGQNIPNCLVKRKRPLMRCKT